MLLARSMLAICLSSIIAITLVACGGGAETTSVAASDASNDGHREALAAVPSPWVGRVPSVDTSTSPFIDYRTYNKSEKVVRGEITRQQYIDGELLVFLNLASDIKSLRAYALSKRFTIVFIGGAILHDVVIQTNIHTEAGLQDVIRELNAFAWIKHSALNEAGTAASSPSFNDPAWSDIDKSWNLKSIRLSEARSLIPAGASTVIKVGVIDQGFMRVHEDMNISVSTAGILGPSGWHGTNVAGVIGAKSNNLLGTTGISGSVEIIGSVWGVGDVSDENAIYTAFQREMLAGRVRIVNMSYGHSYCKSILLETQCQNLNESISDEYRERLITYLSAYSTLIDSSVSSGASMLLVKATGNEGDLTFNLPTEGGNRISAEYSGSISYIGLISPKSTDETELINKIRDHTLFVGAYVECSGGRRISSYTMVPALHTVGASAMRESLILAPGGDRCGILSNIGIYSLSGPNTNSYAEGATFGRTSAAAPHVSGVAALILQINPSFTASQVRDIILSSADTNLGTPYSSRAAGDGSDGYRYLNAEAAVKEAIRRKTEANCGTITSPKAFGQEGSESIVKAGQPMVFSTVPSPKAGYSFASYQWKTSEGIVASGVDPSASITFNTVGTSSWLTVIPSLADGTVCTGAAATSPITVQDPPTVQWDAFADFSLIANPNGAWHYRYDLAGQPLQSMGSTDTNCGGIILIGCWEISSTAYGLPFIGKNATGSVITSTTVRAPANMLLLHPADSGAGRIAYRPVITWTAPGAGTYYFNGKFQIADIIPTGIRVIVKEDSTTLVDEVLNGFGAVRPILMTRTLNAGQVISFTIDAAGVQSNDSTGFSMTVTRQ